MNIQEYIVSGIVESYVLGLANEQERTEFESMCAVHAEVKSARDSFEILLEQQLLSNAIAPAINVRSQVLEALEKQNQDTSLRIKKGNVSDRNSVENTPVVTIGGWFKYAAAASIVLLIGSTALNFYFFNQYKSVSAKYDGLVKENMDFTKNDKILRTSIGEYQSAIEKLRNPSMAIIKMEGNAVPTSPDPTSMATVYWDKQTKDVYLVVNNMPDPTAGKQYQLWAIVDGIPVDAGVFTIEKGVPLVTMKNIPKAQAFAITLENKGGSPSPLGQMYVLGKVT